jgi:acyl carrier protein
MTEISDRIRAILAEQAMLDVADVTLEARLVDPGVDSLALVEAIFAIEEAFDVSVPFNANEPGRAAFDISTVGSVVAAVEGLIARKAA